MSAVHSQDYFNAIDQAFELLDHGVIFLDAKGSVTFANRCAAEIAHSGCGLRLSAQGVSLEDTATNRMLQAVLSQGQTASDGRVPCTSHTVIVRAQNGKARLKITVTPLRDQAGAPQAAISPSIVFIYRLDRETAPQQTVLRDLFGLTAGEASIVQLLASGKSLHEIAGIRGVTVLTIRTVLKRTFWKTGAHRQADLVRIALQVDAEAGR